MDFGNRSWTSEAWRGCNDMARRYEVRICQSANREHRSSVRQYAHVFHHDGVICVASKLFDLPPRIMLGILVHELGHLALANKLDHGEPDADAKGGDMAGIRIMRVSSRSGSNLESVRAMDIEAAIEYVEKRTNLRFQWQ